jgi:hypothetical protein
VYLLPQTSHQSLLMWFLGLAWQRKYGTYLQPQKPEVSVVQPHLQAQSGPLKTTFYADFQYWNRVGGTENQLTGQGGKVSWPLASQDPNCWAGKDSGGIPATDFEMLRCCELCATRGYPKLEFLCTMHIDSSARQIGPLTRDQAIPILWEPTCQSSR